ncbi:MAG: hypothetical protein ACOCRX_05025 [Candidatus Woesearchaeota archaeon]
MTKYFYCKSYQMLNLALYYKHILNENIIIITPESRIIEVCNFLNTDYIEHHPFKFKGWKSLFPYWLFLKYRKKVINEITRVNNIIKEEELHFSHDQFAVFCFLLISYNKNSSIYFHDFEFKYPRNKFPFPNIKSYIIWLQMFLIKGIYKNPPLELRKTSNSGPVISLKHEFIIKKCNIFDYDADQYHQKTLALFKSLNINYPEIDRLFIAQNHNLNSKNYTKKQKLILEKIFATLNEYNFKVKRHPKFQEPFVGYDFPEIHRNIPVEFFFNKINICVVSFHSSALITAAKLDKFKVISLIDLIVDREKSYMQKWKKKLIKDTEDKIYFPQTLDELKNLLNE